MTKKILSLGFVFAAVSVFAVGCAAPGEDDDSPQADLDNTEERASITYNGNTITANTPGGQVDLDVYGSASFTLSGRQGVCLLEVSSTLCNPSLAKRASGEPSDCTSYFGIGGYSYCGQVNATGSYYCMYRKGTQSQQCAGSPALPPGADGFPQVVAAGTYQTPSVNTSQNTTIKKWVSYACVNGCKGATSEPSVSSASFTSKGCRSGSISTC